ncbi:MAG: hypothetical protein R6V52_10700 [Bacteroidales bacterium]
MERWREVHKDGSRQLVCCDAVLLQRRAEWSDGAELLPGHVSSGRAVHNYRLQADPPFFRRVVP